MLDLPDLKSRVFAELAGDPRLGGYHQRCSQFLPIDPESLPALEVAIYRVPAQTASQGDVKRTPEIEVHVLRGSSRTVEDDAALDAPAIETCILRALVGHGSVIAYDLGGWEFRPSGDGDGRYMRAVVRVSAQFFDTLNVQ